MNVWEQVYELIPLMLALKLGGQEDNYYSDKFTKQISNYYGKMNNGSIK